MSMHCGRYWIVPVGRMLPPMVFMVFVIISLRYLGYDLELAIFSIDVTEAHKGGGFWRLRLIIILQFRESPGLRGTYHIPDINKDCVTWQRKECDTMSQWPK